MSTKWVNGLVATWLVFIFVALLNYEQLKIQPFDPDMALSAHAATMEYDTRLMDALESRGITTRTLVHFTDNQPCYCDNLAEQHKIALAESLSEQGYSITTLIVDEELSLLLSRYPALAVIDGSMRLRYLGPYASGIGCWVGDDTVTNIARLVTANQYEGAVINADVSGCFCAFSV